MEFKAPFAFGDSVIIDGDTTMVGRVTAFLFRSEFPQAEVSWIHNGTSNSAWFDNWRLSPAPQKGAA